MESLTIQARRRFKDAVYGEFARVTSALANPKRLEMVDLLAQRERTVQDVADEMGSSIANASQHLRALLDARLVEVRREGTYAYYRLADPAVFEAWRALRTVAESRNAELHAVTTRFLGTRAPVTDAEGDAFDARVRDGGLVLLDVRPKDEFEAGHIPGARSIQVDEVADYARTLSRESEIVAYCRGPYCVFADEAVEILRAHGLRASRLALGYPDWRALRFPTTSPLSPQEATS